MAELKPIEVEAKSRWAFRPIHYLAGFMWLNFYAVVWAWLLGYLPAGGATGSGVFAFAVFAMVASTYSAGGKK